MNEPRDAVDAPGNETVEEPGPAEVARGFLRGEPEAAQRVRSRVQIIVGFRGYGIPTEDRKDLVQQVMAQAWQRMNGDGIPSLDDFWGFIEVVTARRCIDWLRRHKTRGGEVSLDVELVDHRQDPYQSTEERQRRRLAVAALSQISEPCRKLIYLHAGRNLSYAEIAPILGRSEGALRIQMFRCMRRARRALAELTVAEAEEHRLE